MNQQETIDALAEQNRLLRSLFPSVRPEYGAVGSRDVDVANQQAVFDAVIALPDLSTSILNKRDARVLQEAIGVCEELLLGRSTFSTDEIFGIRCCIREIKRLAAEKEKQ